MSYRKNYSQNVVARCSLAENLPVAVLTCSALIIQRGNWVPGSNPPLVHRHPIPCCQLRDGF